MQAIEWKNKTLSPQGVMQARFGGNLIKSVVYLRNGPDKNDSNNGNEHVGLQKRC